MPGSPRERSLFPNPLPDESDRKRCGAYYTPDAVVRSLVRWAVVRPTDRMLDPSCGDGRFLVVHPKSVGVEQDPHASAIVHERAPGSLIHEGDFFAWAAETQERFECTAGNPPFIRYQRFAGPVRETALRLCARLGATFSSLSSSWAPFLVAASGLLKPGGRMAFVVPAEIGHAPYARPLLEHLAGHFSRVQVIAVREKVFPDLSEDCWLLCAGGYGGQTDHFQLSSLEQFSYSVSPPERHACVGLNQWRQWNCRLRPFLLPADLLARYGELAASRGSVRLGQVAKVGIGYVTGANDFFHLRPSQAAAEGIPARFLRPAVRNGRLLTGRAITPSTVEDWRRRDDPMLLLRLRPDESLPAPVRRYLDSAPGREARKGYKCRTREPWYVVPDVTVPDAFLSYMSGHSPLLVSNQAECVCTNSVHAVVLSGSMHISELQDIWDRPLTRLSCEIEGHPLGGGMLKLEPREAARVVVVRNPLRSGEDVDLVLQGIDTLRHWRHYSAPKLEPATRRLEWDADSPAVRDDRMGEYEPRIAHGDE